MRKTTKMVAVLAAMSVMILGAATMVSAAEKQGWVKEGSDWYYYNKDKAVINGWAQDGAGKWYFLGEEGKMVTEAFVDDDALLEVATSDVSLGEYTDYYYVGTDGAMVTGWAEIKTGTDTKGPTGTSGDKTWFYFGESGLMYADAWVLSGSNWYWIDENGRMVKNTVLTGDKAYYLDANGVMVTGWHKVANDDSILTEGAWVYADANGELVQTGWKKVDGNWYHFGAVSAAATAVVNGTTGETYEMNKDTFIKVGSEIFNLKASGAMTTGLFKLKAGTAPNYTDTYYFAKSNGKLEKAVQSVGGKNYYFDASTYVRDEDAKYVTEKDGVFKVVTKAEADNDTDARKLAVDGTIVYKLGTGTKFK